MVQAGALLVSSPHPNLVLLFLTSLIGSSFLLTIQHESLLTQYHKAQSCMNCVEDGADQKQGQCSWLWYLVDGFEHCTYFCPYTQHSHAVLSHCSSYWKDHITGKKGNLDNLQEMEFHSTNYALYDWSLDSSTKSLLLWFIAQWTSLEDFLHLEREKDQNILARCLWYDLSNFSQNRIWLGYTINNSTSRLKLVQDNIITYTQHLKVTSQRDVGFCKITIDLVGKCKKLDVLRYVEPEATIANIY